MKWNAADYAANSAVQHSWAHELIARLNLRGDEHILDVGCGDGKVTAELARAVPRGSITGADASPQMIEFANKQFPANKFSNLRFRVMDARKIKFERRFDAYLDAFAQHDVKQTAAIAYFDGAGALIRLANSPEARMRAHYDRLARFIRERQTLADTLFQRQ